MKINQIGTYAIKPNEIILLIMTIDLIDKYSGVARISMQHFNVGLHLT